MSVDWKINLKKNHLKMDEVCLYYHPSTQNVELRTVLGHMNKMHNWQFSEKYFSGYKGNLSGVVQEFYEQI